MSLSETAGTVFTVAIKVTILIVFAAFVVLQIAMAGDVWTVGGFVGYVASVAAARPLEVGGVVLASTLLVLWFAGQWYDRLTDSGSG